VETPIFNALSVSGVYCGRILYGMTGILVIINLLTKLC